MLARPRLGKRVAARAVLLDSVIAAGVAAVRRMHGASLGRAGCDDIRAVPEISRGIGAGERE
jgi:hypothetical protein